MLYRHDLNSLVNNIYLVHSLDMINILDLVVNKDQYSFEYGG